jgi:hypothetical protein
MSDRRRVGMLLVVLATGALLVVLPAQATPSAGEVTLIARPSVASPDHPITLFGTVKSGRPGEVVEILTKDCGHSFFRVAISTHSQAGGRWSTTFFPAVGTTVRARWNGRLSAPVKVGQRAMLRFAPRAGDRTRFEVSVVARAQFWRKRVVIERLNRQRGAWVRYRSVVLTTQEAPGEFVWTSGQFTARLPRGTLLRALLPQSQAGRCYLSSYSLPLRTG